MGVIIKELAELYNNFTAGSDLPIRSPRIQHKDYAVWINNLVQSHALDQSRSFWMNQFKDEVHTLELPTLIPRPVTRSFESERKSLVVEEELNILLKKWATENKVTLYTLLLSAINVVVSLHSKQKELVIGSPVSGRLHVELENQIGLFLNIIAIRTRIDDHETFAEFTQRVGRHVVDCFDHQLFPFDELIDRLRIQPDQNRNPLFDIGFNLSNEESAADTDFKGLRINRVDGGFRAVKTDLWINAEEKNSSLWIAIDYNKQLFGSSFVQEIADNLKELFNYISKGGATSSLAEIITHLAGRNKEARKENKSRILQQNLKALKEKR